MNKKNLIHLLFYLLLFKIYTCVQNIINFVKLFSKISSDILQLIDFVF